MVGATTGEGLLRPGEMEATVDGLRAALVPASPDLREHLSRAWAEIGKQAS